MLLYFKGDLFQFDMIREQFFFFRWYLWLMKECILGFDWYFFQRLFCLVYQNFGLNVCLYYEGLYYEDLYYEGFELFVKVDFFLYIIEKNYEGSS